MAVWRTALAASLVVVPLVLTAQSRSAPSFAGAWRVTEVVVTGANASTNRSPQPGMMLFTGRHYSTVTVNASEARNPLPPLKDPAKPSEAELRERYAHWNPVTAQAGTYEVKGNMLITRPVVAKNQGVAEGPPLAREFMLDGNTLTLIQRSAAGQPQAVTTTKLTRLE